MSDEQPKMHFVYCNHKGEVTERRVELPMLWFGATPWYPKPQWLMRAYDFDKEAMRDFAVASIRQVHS